MKKTLVLINSPKGENISVIEIENTDNIPSYLNALAYARKYKSGEYFEFTNYLNPIAEKLGVSYPHPLKEVILNEENIDDN